MVNIEETIQEIILSNLVNKNVNITPETDLIKDIGLDSISLMMIVVGIEEKFSIELPDEFLTEDNLSKYIRVVSMVEKLLDTNKQN